MCFSGKVRFEFIIRYQNVAHEETLHGDGFERKCPPNLLNMKSVFVEKKDCPKKQKIFCYIDKPSGEA